MVLQTLDKSDVSAGKFRYGYGLRHSKLSADFPTPLGPPGHLTLEQVVLKPWAERCLLDLMKYYTAFFQRKRHFFPAAVSGLFGVLFSSDFFDSAV